jgi:hypothetical protein
MLLMLGAWIAISFIAVTLFALGAAIGRRRAWEEGYRSGRRDAVAAAQVPARGSRLSSRARRTTRARS